MRSLLSFTESWGSAFTLHGPNRAVLPGWLNGAGGHGGESKGQTIVSGPMNWAGCFYLGALIAFALPFFFLVGVLLCRVS